jgi:alcohol dehydrogenase
MLKNFTFSPKTRIIFGKDAELQLGDEIAKYGMTCLIHHDGGAYLNALLERIRTSLIQRGITIVELGGVLPNPRYSLVREGIELCRRENVDFILAVGGGSVMDSAKFIAYGVNSPQDPWLYKSFTPIKHPILPHGCVSTLPGTGSELSAAAMILNDTLDHPVKGHFTNGDFRFDFAVINPELSYSLPPRQTAAGSMDIISHAMESYFSNTPNSYLLDGYLENVIRTVMRLVPKALAQPDDYDVRANLWIASLMAIESYPAMSTQGDWVVHNIEKPLTAMYKGTHGVNLGILTVAWMKYMAPHSPQQFVRFATQIMGVPNDEYDPQATITEGIRRFESWLIAVGLPTRLHEVGIDPKDFPAAAELALEVAGFKGREGTIGMISKLTFDQMQAIYALAYQ